MTPPPAAATAAARQPARTTTRPAPRPRRVSGPAHPARPLRRPAAVPRRELPFGARALDRVRALPDHRLLHRLIGGRMWIALIGTLLVGIVTLQLSLLKLNAGIGRAVAHTAVLEQGNAALSAEISRLSDPQRISDIALGEGFVQPLQGTPRFLAATPGDASRALTTMRVPQQSTTTIPAATIAPVSDATTTTDPAATTADPTAAAGTMTTTVPSTTTTDQTATSGAATTAPVTPTAPTDAAATAGTTVAGGAAAPQG